MIIFRFGTVFVRIFLTCLNKFGLFRLFRLILDHLLSNRILVII